MEEAIVNFLSTRKADKLKKVITPSLSDDERNVLEASIDAAFTLEQWLPNAAKRASQLSLVSHPAKFSHPSAKATPIAFDGEFRPDGYIRSGNLKTDLDAFGNAAAMDVYKFLSLTLSDGKSVLQHIEARSDKIKEIVSETSSNFDDICDQFLSIKYSNHQDTFTSAKIKQVYFPVSNDYHLLSILTPSGIVYEIKSRINVMKFSEQAKQARELKRKKQFSETGFDDIYNLTTIGYGGTKPQNISVLNSANGGKAYLLPCFPPALEVSRQRLPKRDFFSEILWLKEFNEFFDGIKRLIDCDINNIKIRKGIDDYIQLIIDAVIKSVWKVRLKMMESSSVLVFEELNNAQRLWLDHAKVDERTTDENWFETVADHFSCWFVAAYKKRTNQALDKHNFHRFRDIVLKNKEYLI